MTLKRPLEEAGEPHLIKKRKTSKVSRQKEPTTSKKVDTSSTSNMDFIMKSRIDQFVIPTPEPTIMNRTSSPPRFVKSPSSKRVIPPCEATETNARPEIKGSDILPENLAHLTKKYLFATMTIKSHSKINNKVRGMIRHMSRFDFMDPNIKPGVIALDARASDANKLITVVEIVKKDIFENNRSGKWYQYNRVASKLIQIPRTSSKNDVAARGCARLQNDEDAMDLGGLRIVDTATNHRVDTTMKSRAIPMLTIYLSQVPLPELKQEFGEQNNEKDIVKWWEPVPSR